MYAGRIVSVGLTKSNRLCVMYRVSSRSFPNRVIKEMNRALVVVPAKEQESDIYKNPYIAYNCLRCDDRYAVVGNGTQTDFVFEKLQAGMTMKDALISVLYGMDFEHDHLGTPRISAVIDKKSRQMSLGIVRTDGLEVKVFELEPGNYQYISTYKHSYLSHEFSGSGFDPENADDACNFIHKEGAFRELTNPIASASAMESEDGFETCFRQLV